MYGLGDLMLGGNSGSRSMGALGIAMRNTYEFNYANPASLSSLPRNTAVFNFGMSNSNYYQKLGTATNSYNGVSLNDVGFAIPLYRGIGLGVSLTPISAVGYNTSIVNNNAQIIENIGRAVYSYYGEGGVSQVALSLGVKVVAGLSLGAQVGYYFGSIDRHWESNIYSVIQSNSYRIIRSSEFLRTDHLVFNFGAQYQFRVGDDDNLTIGATYMPATSINAKRSALTVTSSNNLNDTVGVSSAILPIRLADKFAAGIFFSNPKFGIGLDYYRQDWRNSFQTPAGISLTVVNDFRFGAQYTPDRNSIRSFFSRLTYKVGARYANSYLIKDNIPLDEWAVTLGFDIPLKKQNYSAFHFGLEYGERGSINPLSIREQYFKVFLGLSLFAGDDMWFVRRKFK